MNFVYDGKPELGECGLAVVSVVERLDHSYNNIFTVDPSTVADGIYSSIRSFHWLARNYEL
jgi:hypothetical protein